MTTGLRTFILFLVSVGAVTAQSAYLYTNVASDGVFVSITGLVQSSSWGGSYGTVHTYSQSLSVSSPSGRSNSCSFYNPVPASTNFSQQCEAQLSINDDSGIFEQGPYYISGEQRANCSQVGTFAYSPISDTVPLMHIKAYYSYTGSQNQGHGVYNRCHPIGTTCDYCDIIIGSPIWQYGLFDGAEIHIRGGAGCTMVAIQQVNDCSLPDPVPGTGGGVAELLPRRDFKGSPKYRDTSSRQEKAVAHLHGPAGSNTAVPGISH